MVGEHAHREIRDGCDVIETVVSNTDPIERVAEPLLSADRVTFLGCGSSYWSGVVGRALLRNAGVDAHVEYAPEFLYESPPIGETDVAVGLSQSGETTETIRALETAADNGATTVAITNTDGSTLAEMAHHTIVTPAGDERAVMATKSVDAVVTTLYLLADRIGGSGWQTALAGATDRVEAVIESDVSEVVSVLTDAECAYTLGTGGAYGLAGEAATKLGEAMLLHTTALPTLEINHGPIANVAGDVVIWYALDNAGAPVSDHVLDGLRDAGARTVVVHPHGTSYDATATIELPASVETLLPALKLTQRVAYAGAMELGYDPDSPPQLSKHVEIEGI
ncbi:SIS domain-containing protein [Halorhabdus sp. CBA1104]|uniref:SIS domain-containing protein n=1 Tax=Halorhabdus sp. CBA1104 TaxID=1380432 RepID=UPI0012B21B0A|nr:SIS domain-containing protein [Halorhabdus sp. CBA1104]QGN07025.1 SIS domain-containing protein [Halorhabdus sp. CBA1104]